MGKNNRDIYLYGSGRRCRSLVDLMEGTDFRICGVIDSNPQKQGGMLNGFEILPPEILCASSGERVCVTFYGLSDTEPIWEELQSRYGIGEERICTFHQMLVEVYMEKGISIPKLQSVADGDLWNFCFDASWDMGIGGIESWMRDIRKAFDERNDIDVSWLAYDDPDYGREWELEFCADKVEAGIVRIIRLLPCAIVFSKTNEMMLAAYLIKKVFPKRVRMIMAVHNSCDGTYRDVLSYRDAIEYYVCVNSGMKKTLERAGIGSDKVSTMTIPVPYEANNNRFYTVERSSPLRLGYAGRLEVPQKRIDLLMELVLELEKRKVDYILAIAGEGAMYPDISRFIDENSLRGKVKLLGVVERSAMPRFWDGQDIAINMSDSEGRGLANMEAMASGCVPAVTRTVGVMEDVTDGENGIAVPIGDYKLMAEKIQFLDEHRELLEQMGPKARAEMLPKISMERHLDLWTDILTAGHPRQL